MAILVLVSLICLALVVYPFFQKEQIIETQNLLPLIEEKESIYVSLKEIKEDFLEGKLSQEDYEQLELQLKQKAVDILKKLDKKEKKKDKKIKSADLEKSLEEEIAKKRKELKSGVQKEEKNFCAKCGQQLRAGDAFCAKCGAKILSLVLFFLFFYSQTFAAVIKGKVIESSTKKTISNISVTLEILAKAKSEKKDTETNAQGEYVFKVVDNQQTSYILSAIYNKVDYQSQPFNIKKNEEQKAVNLYVYPTTTKDNNIVISTHHIIVMPQNDGFLFHEVVIVENTAKETYIGIKNNKGKKETLRFSIPKGAKNVQLAEGLMQCCTEILDGEIVSTQPVKYGAKQISFSYVLIPDNDNLIVNTMVNYATMRLDYFIPQINSKITSKFFGAPKVVELEKKKYFQLGKEMIESGSVVDFVLIAGQTGAHKSRALKNIVIGITILLFLGGIVFIFSGDKKEEETYSTKDEIIEAIAKLDIDYEEGNIDKINYNKKRNNLKKLLKKYERDE